MLTHILSSLASNASYIASILALLFLPSSLRPQSPEPTGKALLYNDTTIAALHHIADSLQTIFDTLTPGQPFISNDQTIGSFVHLRGDSTAIAEAGRALDDGASFDEIITRFPTLLYDTCREVVITRQITDEQIAEGIAGDSDTTYRAMAIPEYLGHSYFRNAPGSINHASHGSWVWLAARETDEAEDDTVLYSSIRALDLSCGFTRVVIPERYARLIRYTDFMAGVNTPLLLQEYHEIVWNGDYRWRKDEINSMIALPELDAQPSQRVSADRYRQWSEECDIRYNTMAYDSAFVANLDSTAETCIREQIQDVELMTMVERCIPNAHGLELIRRLPSFRGCDRGPDYFQIGCIARLAATTLHWNIFLQAHLMALGRPFTLESSADYHHPSAYTHELEAIGLDLPSLLLGMWLRFEQPAQNHLWIDDYRALVAMCEAHGCKDIEEMLLAAMKDRTLDDFNRWRAYDLYLSYIVALPSILRTARLADLRSCGDELPGYIRDHLLSLPDDE